MSVQEEGRRKLCSAFVCVRACACVRVHVCVRAVPAGVDWEFGLRSVLLLWNL